MHQSDLSSANTDSTVPSPARNDTIERDEAAEPVWEQMSPRVYRNLDEIFAGEYEGKTYAEVRPLCAKLSRSSLSVLFWWSGIAGARH